MHLKHSAAAAAAALLMSTSFVLAAEAPEACLGCHGGSLESLADKTTNYKDEWGDPVNPHLYIDPKAFNPHASKMLPDCVKCHEPHGMPPKKSAKKASLQYCYGCHHMESFENCGSAGCHEGRNQKK